MAEEADSLADELIDDILADNPGHRPGTRPIHAPGVAATGWFQATEAARHFTAAEHFGGQRVRVTVRFSNGTGAPDGPDADPSLVRGMAVKFHLGDGPGERETDMIAMSLPVFFVRTVDEFRQFTASARPQPVRRPPRWRILAAKVADQLLLRAGPPVPAKGETESGALGLYEYVRGHEFAGRGSVGLALLVAPESYSTCSYNGVHAFVLTDHHGGRRAVRFRWEPVDGVRAAPEGTTGNYLAEELRESLARNAVEFVLRMQVAEQGDDTSDPTRAWPQARPRIVMGHLLLDTLAPDQRSSAELIGFNPTRLVDGIAQSDDATLRIRGPVYDRSAQRRRAEAAAAAQTMTRTSATDRPDGA